MEARYFSYIAKKRHKVEQMGLVKSLGQCLKVPVDIWEKRHYHLRAVPLIFFRDFYTTDLGRKRQRCLLQGGTACTPFATISIQADRISTNFSGIPECASTGAEFYCFCCAKHPVLHQKGASFSMSVISLKLHLSMEANSRLVRCSHWRFFPVPETKELIK